MCAAATPAVKQLLADFERAQQINAENLKAILAENRDTVYGQRFGFADIHSVEEYGERVPLTDYSDYEELMSVPNGVTAYPVAYMLATSGTTNKQKLFPLTYESLSRFSTSVHEMPFYLMDMRGMSMHVSVFRSPKDGKMLLSSAYHTYLKEQGAFERTPYIGGTELLFSDEIEDVAYLKTWLALSCPELIHIQSVYLYDVLLFFRYLEDNWRIMLSDMRSGNISGALTPAVKEKLLKYRPTAEQIDALQSIFSQGFDTPIAKRIWKDLRVISGIGGKMFSLHEEALLRYIGDIDVCHCVYGASECVMGVPVAPNKAHYALLPRAAYYEFYSILDGRVVGMEELKTGGQYELVLTTFSGLYRYTMTDIITVVSFIGEAPVVEVSGRFKNLLNVAGEKIDEPTMRAAISGWAAQMKLVLGDCAAGVDMHGVPGRYHIFIETNSLLPDAGQMERAFDDALRSVSPDYMDVRKLKMLAAPRVHVMPTGSITGSKGATGVTTAHNKPQLFLNVDQTDYLIQRSESHEEQ